MEPLTLALAVLVVFGATLVGAIAGFGSGILAMSLLAIFLPFKTAVVAFALSASLSHIQLSWQIRTEYPLKASLSIVIGRWFGVALGVLLLSLPLDLYAKIILSILIIMLALQALRSPIQQRHDLPGKISIPPLTGLGLGVLSGVLNGWINMGGPPIIVYAFKTFSARSARHLLIAVMALSAPFQLLMVWYKGLITAEALILFLWFAPVTIAATFIGHRLQRKINKETFTRVVWSLLLILGIILGATTFLK